MVFHHLFPMANKVTGEFVTTSDLIKIEDKEFLYNSAPDTKGYYKSYWTVNRGTTVFTVQNINL